MDKPESEMTTDELLQKYMAVNAKARDAGLANDLETFYPLRRESDRIGV